jgi:hypothetical protein
MSTVHLPVTSLTITLKSMRFDDLDDAGRWAVLSRFPGFMGPRSAGDPRYRALLKETDVQPTEVDFAGDLAALKALLPAPRRFAGDRTLARGSYFTICHDSRGLDDGTLVRELGSYGNPPDAPGMRIEERLDAERALLRVAFEPGLDPVLESLHRTREVVLPLRVKTRRVAGVIDLRQPAAQLWFVETFGDPEVMQGSRAAGYVRDRRARIGAVHVPREPRVAEFITVHGLSRRLRRFAQRTPHTG